MFTESDLSDMAKGKCTVKLINIGWSFPNDSAYISMVVYHENCFPEQIIFHTEDKLLTCPKIGENFKNIDGISRRVTAYFESSKSINPNWMFEFDNMPMKKEAVLTESTLEIYM